MFFMENPAVGFPVRIFSANLSSVRFPGNGLPYTAAALMHILTLCSGFNSAAVETDPRNG